MTYSEMKTKLGTYTEDIASEWALLEFGTYFVGHAYNRVTG